MLIILFSFTLFISCNLTETHLKSYFLMTIFFFFSLSLSLFRLDSVLGSFATYARLKGRYDDDWIDRLNHLYTTIIFIIFTIVVSTKQYVGEPIHCWCPAQFTSGHRDYANNVCWISNTYYVPFEERIPLHREGKQQKEIGYYQWVPMILLFQALLFKVPCILWRILGASGASTWTKSLL